MYYNMKRMFFILCLDVILPLFFKPLCEWANMNESNVLRLIVSFINSQNVNPDRAIRGISAASHCLKRCVGLYPLLQYLCQLYPNIPLWTLYSNRQYQLDLKEGLMTASHCLKRCVELYPFSRTIYTKLSPVYHLDYEPYMYNTYIMQCGKLRMSHPVPIILGLTHLYPLLNNNE